MRFGIIFLVMVISNNVVAQEPVKPEACVALLRKVLNEQAEWVKVHAAEYLLWAGYPDGVKQVFLNEEKYHGTEPPYRVGIWRVLFQCADSEYERVVWLNRIKAAFLDENGPDRIHAAETLAKLRTSVQAEAPGVTMRALGGSQPALAIYTLWSTAFDPALRPDVVKNELIENLTPLSGSDWTKKSISAYALRQFGDLNAAQWERLAEAASREPETSPARVFLLSAAWLTASNAAGAAVSAIRSSVLKYHSAKTKAERSEMAMALAAKGNRDDLPLLAGMFENRDPLGDTVADYDVMAAAAYAILKIEQR
ncbi:hypothetical protein [Dyadobacter sp. 676]|uniref:HEAT repeat domain-containing protein n=1 Tax=Dyadobacter sp. 676 TaxID=3088362 RepID=A0AAU8FJF0_9BACT